MPRKVVTRTTTRRVAKKHRECYVYSYTKREIAFWGFEHTKPFLPNKEGSEFTTVGDSGIDVILCGDVSNNILVILKHRKFAWYKEYLSNELRLAVKFYDRLIDGLVKNNSPAKVASYYMMDYGDGSSLRRIKDYNNGVSNNL